MTSRSERLQRFLYEDDPLLSTGDERALGEALGALGVNAGALLASVLLRQGEDEFEATLQLFKERTRAVARDTARLSQEGA